MFMRRGRTASSKRRALLVLPIWLTTLVWLSSWWFDVESIGALWLYIPLTLALVYESVVMPGAFLYFLLKARSPKDRKSLSGKKVAVITPCVPALESLTIIERQLKAMTEISYPHDSWILDEGNNKQIRQLAKRYGVKYFTRKGTAKYNMHDYPFKAKTKAGNINAWLHKARKYNYDFFVQMDIDHLPKPNYLDKTLGHFRDKKVAWVQAPSVYSNLTSWTARGSAEQEMGFHGPLQMALYGSVDAPVIVGSHTTFRMKAIQDIKGFQPTRAEDHLNTLVLMNKGWKGVFVPEVIAEGDGPETFEAYLSQQYAWAFSMTQILKTYSFRYVKNLSLNRKLLYLFLQTWYPLWSASNLTFFAIPVLGLLFNQYAIDSQGSDYIYRFVPIFISTLFVWWAGTPLRQPQKLKLSWRGLLLHVIRWPVILMAVLSAFMGKIKPYQVTPKGKFLKNVPTTQLYKPFLVLSIISSASLLYAVLRYKLEIDGLYIFVSANLVTLLSVCLVDVNIRLRSNKISKDAFKTYWLKPISAVFSIVLLSFTAVLTLIGSSQQTIYALLPEKSAIEIKKDLPNTLPHLLKTDELYDQIASQNYPHDPLFMPTTGLHSPGYKPVVPVEPYIRHTFVDWREENRLAQELLITLRGNNTAFITIEPKGEADGAKLLADIAAGKHDQTIDRMLTTIGLTDNTVYVRFAHEMDLADLYPWGDQDGDLYIAAYRHVTDMAKSKEIDNIKWVWGPGGLTSAIKYYPGDDIVDIIGTTVLYDQYWNGTSQYSFYELSVGRRWLLGLGKPVWVTEFGVGKANQQYQTMLVQDAVQNYKLFGFSALIYVNITDSNIVGPNYTFEDTESLINILGINELPKMTTPPVQIAETKPSEPAQVTPLQHNKFEYAKPAPLFFKDR